MSEIDVDLSKRLSNTMNLTDEQFGDLMATLGVTMARKIAAKAMECPLRPVPMHFARELRRAEVPAPAYAFRNWAKMQNWYKNSTCT